MPADARRTLQAQLMVVDGQRLFNALGCSLAVRLGVPSGAPDARANRDLADALEIWFESWPLSGIRLAVHRNWDSSPLWSGASLTFCDEGRISDRIGRDGPLFRYNGAVPERG